jgi:hypothetical protein
VATAGPAAFPVVRPGNRVGDASIFQHCSVPEFRALNQESDKVHDLPHRKQNAHLCRHGPFQLHERGSQKGVQCGIKFHVRLNAPGPSFVPEVMILIGPPAIVEMLPAE